MSDFILPKTQKKPSSDEESIKRRRDELENAQKEVYALRITLNDRQEAYKKARFEMRNIEKDKAQAKPEEAKYWTAPYEKSKSTFKDEEEQLELTQGKMSDAQQKEAIRYISLAEITSDQDHLVALENI